MNYDAPRPLTSLEKWNTRKSSDTYMRAPDNPLDAKVAHMLANLDGDISPYINDFVGDIAGIQCPAFIIFKAGGGHPMVIRENDLAPYLLLFNVFRDQYSSDCVYSGGEKILFDSIKSLHLESVVLSGNPHAWHFRFGMCEAQIFNRLIERILRKHRRQQEQERLHNGGGVFVSVPAVNKRTGRAYLKRAILTRG